MTDIIGFVIVEPPKPTECLAWTGVCLGDKDIAV